MADSPNVMKIQPPVLDLTVDRYAAFKAWKDKWEDYVMLSGLEAKDKKFQAAMLRYTFAAETRKTYAALEIADDKKDDPAEIIKVLETFAKGLINETLERHQFNSRSQKEGERFDDYLTEVKIAATNCGFCNTCFPGLLRDRIVGGVRSDKLRKRLLEEKDLDVGKAVEICRSHEVAETGMAKLKNLTEETSASVDGVSESYYGRRDNRTYNNNTNTRSPMTQTIQCKYCSRSHTFGRKYCRAWGKQCMDCKKLNHFSGSVVCTKRNVQGDKEGNLASISDNARFCEERPFKISGITEDDVVHSVEVQNMNNFDLVIKAKRGNLKFKIDTGADVTVIGTRHLKVLGIEEAELRGSKKVFRGANNVKIDCLGYCYLTVQLDTPIDLVCYVCKGVTVPLLGKPEICALNIVEIKVPKEMKCASVVEEKETMIEEVKEMDEDAKEFVQEFPELFEGLGYMTKDPDIEIRLKENATPYQLSAPRRIALPLLPAVKKELDRMESLGVIKKITEPTDWCHPIVVVTKAHSKDLRICIDLTKLNEHIKRELYQLPSVDETLAKIGCKSKYFTKLDANSGYWQMPLSVASQLLCTFISPFGRYAPTRGPFGLASMPEIFSRRTDDMIEGDEGVAKIMDDFLLHGETIPKHDANVRGTMTKMVDAGMTLNIKKCIFRKQKVEFLGYVISSEGIRPVHEKLEAIRKFRSPRSITELRSFLGMARQLAKFSNKLAEKSEPLRGLLSTKNDFVWNSNHEQAFQNVKDILTEPPTLGRYDVTKPTKIRTDGSKLHGISIILLQWGDDQWRTIDCASRFLSEHERNWAVIEIEMLAVVWGIGRMSFYLFGLPEFGAETDHKPLVPILNNKGLVDLTSRLQTMRMKLLQYNIKASYVPGKDLVDADALSRSPVNQPDEKDAVAEREVDLNVGLVRSNLPATERRLEEIKKNTVEDPTLLALKKAILEGWPKAKQDCELKIKPYWIHRADLCWVDEMILKGDRIVIPTNLRMKVLEAIHEGHLGMEKCKRRSRQSVFWPGLSKDIEEKVNKCETCIRLQPSKQKEEMIIQPMPTRAWQKVGTDLFAYNGEHYAIVTDYMSFWSEVYSLRNETAEQVIEAMKDSFAHHGIPQEVMSDNGPQFSSWKFKEFARQWEFKHVTSSPYYPRSNGLAEASVKSVKKLIIKCTRSKEDLKKGLLILRNTPLACGKSPAQLLVGHQLRDNLPTVEHKYKNPHAFKRDLQQEREKSKVQYDKQATQPAPEPVFTKNQRVAIQDSVTKEWSLKGKIGKEITPRSYEVVLEDGRKFRRNRQFIRKIFCIAVSDAKQTTQEKEIVVQNVEQYVEEERVSDDESINTFEFEEDEIATWEENGEDQGSEYFTDSDTSTIPYDKGEDIEVHEEIQIKTKSGRVVKNKRPIDYEDL